MGEIESVRKYTVQSVEAISQIGGVLRPPRRAQNDKRDRKGKKTDKDSEGFFAPLPSASLRAGRMTVLGAREKAPICVEIGQRHECNQRGGRGGTDFRRCCTENTPAPTKRGGLQAQRR